MQLRDFLTPLESQIFENLEKGLRNTGAIFMIKYTEHNYSSLQGSPGGSAIAICLHEGEWQGDPTGRSP